MQIDQTYPETYRPYRARAGVEQKSIIKIIMIYESKVKIIIPMQWLHYKWKNTVISPDVYFIIYILITATYTSCNNYYHVRAMTPWYCDNIGTSAIIRVKTNRRSRAGRNEFYRTTFPKGSLPFGLRVYCQTIQNYLVKSVSGKFPISLQK